jgi:ABC-type branched-subunit amino acid transport system substrate-binding protein
LRGNGRDDAQIQRERDHGDEQCRKQRTQQLAAEQFKVVIGVTSSGSSVRACFSPDHAGRRD